MKLLLYCTKGKPYLLDLRNEFENIKFDVFNGKETLNTGWRILNGKIVGECDYEVEEIYHNSIPYHTHSFNQQELLSECCLGVCELDDYLKGKDGKAIHIENLHIFNEPRELRFYYQKYKNDKHLYNVEKAPQNMMIVIGKQGDKYALVSIHPEYLCKILNGEKTIEIRKKVLKEMVENENKK